MTVPFLIALAFTLMFPALYADLAKVIISLVVITSTFLEYRALKGNDALIYRIEISGWFICLAFVSWPLTQAYF